MHSNAMGHRFMALKKFLLTLFLLAMDGISPYMSARNLYRKLEEVDFAQFLPRIGFLGRSEPASAEL